jgi:glycosyltransferase involved in cell wall biosynthesis
MVCPSEWYENAPYAVIESQAHARPVVAARIGGLPELIEDGVTGQLVPSGDADALAGALAAMDARGAARLDEMGRAGRAAAEVRHDPATHYDRLMAVYARAAARRRPAYHR